MAAVHVCVFLPCDGTMYMYMHVHMCECLILVHMYCVGSHNTMLHEGLHMHITATSVLACVASIHTYTCTALL